VGKGALAALAICKQESYTDRMKVLRFEPTDDLIDICYDNVFKAVFTRDTPESHGALSALLSA
jgi:hypothetical protein